jgi:microcystin-dependent protein|tara:strand:- start:2888 stop:3457 length:570 start_codon:yes stop_codon:yes gene_type:complete
MGLFSDGTEIINGGELLEGGIPTATIVPWSKSAVPTGFLECDGAAVSRSTYSALFSAIGTTYGAGNGSSTFNTPDLANNVPVGKSNNKALASTGGANTVAVTATGNVGGSTANATLSTAQLASHSHGGGGNAVAGYPNPQQTIGFSSANTGAAGSGQGHSHNMSATFSGSAVNAAIVQPYLTLIYIIKT